MAIIEGITKEYALVCNEIDERFNQYVVLTTNKEMLRLIRLGNSVTKKMVLLSYEGSYRNITKYTDEELKSHYENNTQEYKDWCDDVVIYYSSRLVLTKQNVPIMLNFNAFKYHLNEKKEADEALLQAVQEQKAKSKKQSIQDLTRKANKKKAKEERKRKEFEKSAAEKELEKLKEKKKKQKKTSKA